MSVYLPPLEQIIERWPLVSRHLSRATRRTGCYEPIDLLRLAMVGQIGIWFCEVDNEVAAVLVSEVKQYPRRRILEMLFAGGGRMRDWLPVAIANLDKYARQCECTHLFALGRASWARAWQGELTGDVAVVRDVKGLTPNV